MKIIFTKSKLPLSKLIRWGLREPVSHCAIVFDDCLVFHSSFLGVDVAWFSRFCKSYEIVFTLNYDLPLETEESIYKAVISQHIGKSYDWRSFWHLTKSIFTGKRSPRQAANNTLICTEVLGLIPVPEIQERLGNANLELLSPYETYVLLKLKEV